MEVKAIAKNISVSPKRLRPILNTVRGKPVTEALAVLSLLPKYAAADVAKAIRSAMANAENNFSGNPEGMRVAMIRADEGIKLRRFMPHARGRAGAVRKRHSHITVVISDEEAQGGA